MKTQYLFLSLAMMFLFASCAKDKLETVNTHVNTEASVMEKGASGKHFTVSLSGSNEVPPNDSKAAGQAIFHLRNNGTELHYKLIVANIENVSMAHIHMAHAGQNGGVVAWLYPSGPPPQLIDGPVNGILHEGVITSADLVGGLAGSDLSDLIDVLMAHGAYVNIHTSQFPGGELRGQF